MCVCLHCLSSALQVSMRRWGFVLGSERARVSVHPFVACARVLACLCAPFLCASLSPNIGVGVSGPARVSATASLSTSAPGRARVLVCPRVCSFSLAAQVPLPQSTRLSICVRVRVFVHRHMLVGLLFCCAFSQACLYFPLWAHLVFPEFVFVSFLREFVSIAPSGCVCETS